MPLETRCGHCGKRLRAPDQLAGKRVKCPACGGAIDVPALAELPRLEETILPGSDPLGLGPPAGRPLDDFDRLMQASGGAFPTGFPLAATGPLVAPRRKSPGLTRPMVIGLCVVGGVAALAIAIGVVLSASKDSPPDLATGPAGLDAPAPNSGTAGSSSSPPSQEELSLRWNRQGDIELAELRLPGTPGQPGQGMNLYLYRPAGSHEPHSLPCIFIAPAGASLVTGMGLGDGDRQEHYPWVHAGYAVVSYEIDGAVDLARATYADLQTGFKKFSAAAAGLTNARLAIRQAQASCPEIDPGQLFVAGHSSAATLALIVAENETNLRGCVAFAPVSDLPERAAAQKEVFDRIPGSAQFFQTCSPHLHAERLNCPLFLFHAADDDNVPVQQSQKFAADLQRLGKQVKLQLVPRGGHYQSMIAIGIPQAIAWVQTQGATPKLPQTTASALPAETAAGPSVDLATDGPIVAPARRLPPQEPAELQASPAPTRWNVTVDGGQTSAAAFGDRKARVSVDGDFSPATIGLTANPSPFVAVREPQDSFGVWNLATGRRIAQIKSDGGRLDGLALSDDGQFLAGRNQHTQSLEVWSCAKRKQELNVPFKGLGQSFVQFGQSGRVVFGQHEHNRFQVFVYSFPKGERVAEAELPAEFRQIEMMAISPGGRYLAAIEKSLLVIDLENGETAGEVDLPLGKQHQFNQTPAPLGCDFSPDGTSLVALCKVGSDTMAIVWDVKTGKVVEHTTIHDSGQGFGYHSGRAIQWAPNQQDWLLFRQIIVDRKTGQVIWPAGNAKRRPHDATAARYIDDDHLLVVSGQGFKRTITPEPLAGPNGKNGRGRGIRRRGGGRAPAAAHPVRYLDGQSPKRVPRSHGLDCRARSAAAGRTIGKAADRVEVQGG